ncbi:hypothetical protein EV11_1802 [Prochlorococcus sp. SS52]|nr:hypothetical protein EV04_1851 [Prochlorococcus marinus str. LG]KGG20469.1 hypothetical protein EV08_1054 [Prochlorococcus marinus str. SS2]KGG24137.1 hypothetical protein EV09_0743 [Prochlorococcus marinus str. SS35]KGG31605.1 hypothetical protein EV10_1699 [Prochlorococcus marinus str. SS51]KGG34672.1 hypothetical protein EV11_1802 [Prochlorococcus sp. SS52]
MESLDPHAVMPAPRAAMETKEKTFLEKDMRKTRTESIAF